MTNIVLVAFVLSVLTFIYLGLRYRGLVKGLADILPVLSGRTAHVANSSEFSNSTSAAALSMATVVVAYFELVPGLGLWLLWPALTTGLGLLVFGVLGKRIWTKMSAYSFRPTLHQYLGVEYNSNSVAMIASVATVLGYMATFSVELLVGGRFISALVPSIPQWLTIAILAATIITYTSYGGFRVVVVTDKIMFRFIWLLIVAMVAYYAVTINRQGWAESVANIPEGIRGLKWNSGLMAFIWGIAIMNLLTYIGNMGLWQRVAGTGDPSIVTKGMWSSVFQTVISWSLLALLGVGAFMLVTPVDGENILITVMKSMEGSVIGLVGIFCISLGLLAALLSTGSTLLIACTGTVSEDLMAPFQKIGLEERAEMKSELVRSRLILIISGVASLVVVAFLQWYGFSVADLAFIVYGAALGLVPPILISLFLDKEVTKRLSSFALFAVGLGFLASWITGAYGKAIGDGNLVFLSPLASTVVAALIMVIGWLAVKGKSNDVVGS